MHNVYFRANILFCCLLCSFSSVNADEFEQLNESDIRVIFYYLDSKFGDDVFDSEALYEIYEMFADYDFIIVDHPEIFDFAFEVLKNEGFIFTDEEMAEIKEYFLTSRSSFDMLGQTDPRMPSQKQPNYSNNFLLGFMQILGGAIISIVPTPFTQTLGTGLVISGIQTIYGDMDKDKTNVDKNNIEKEIKKISIGNKTPKETYIESMKKIPSHIRKKYHLDVFKD